MKSKDLIKRLQELDPTGEIPVCAMDNTDIYFLGMEPAYYDGILEQLVLDPNEKCYNVIGVQFIADGHKIRINNLSARDAVENRPDNCSVEYFGLSAKNKKKITEEIEKIRVESRKEIEEFKRKREELKQKRESNEDNNRGE